MTIKRTKIMGAYLAHAHTCTVSRVHHHDHSVTLFVVGCPEGAQVLLAAQVPDLCAAAASAHGA